MAVKTEIVIAKHEKLKVKRKMLKANHENEKDNRIQQNVKSTVNLLTFHHCLCYVS